MKVEPFKVHYCRFYLPIAFDDLLVDLLKCYVIYCIVRKEDNQSDASMENRRIHTVNFGCQATDQLLPSFLLLPESLSVASLTQIFIIFVLVLRPHKSRAVFCCCGHSFTHPSHCHIILSSFFFFFFGSEQTVARVAVVVLVLVAVASRGRMTVSFASRASLLQEHMTKTLKI